jgi:class 3 adenylate cyclase
MLIFDIAAARWWLAVAIGVVVAAVIADPLIVEVAPASWREAPPLLHALNVIGVTVIVVVLVRLVDGERLTAQRAYHRLLLRILPPAIVDRLTAGEAVVAQHHPSVSVVMADIAGFTAFADRAAPEAVLRLLTDLFSAFDRIVAEAGIEKIKTVGDAYLAVAGAPAERPDHADAAMRVAVRMQREATSLPAMVGSGLQLRVGVASGPVTAGVIGTDKPVYDVWGDTVNVASRMESTGVVGRVQLSEATASALDGAYPLVRRQGVAVKGKGSVDTYLLDPASI